MAHLYATHGSHGWSIFLLVTILMGGGAAFVTGRAVADTWRPFWHLFAYAVLLALAVRFLQFALFAQPFIAPLNVLIDGAVLVGLGTLGYRLTRARQMATQYSWLDKPSKPVVDHDRR